MPMLVNVAQDDLKPLFLVASDITAISVDKDRKEMTINTPKGQLMYINYESFNVDPDILVKKLAEAGNKMVYFPTRYEDREMPQYISPAAVTFATVTEVTKDDGVQGAIVGVRGFGRVETYKAKPEEVEALLKAAEDAGVKLQKYTPDVVHARWYKPAALYIDPKAVEQITDSGHGQIDVNFRDSGRLDIQSPRDSDTRSKRVSDIAARLWKEKNDDDADLNALWADAEKEIKGAEDKKRAEFIDSLIAGGADVVKMPGTKYPLYARPQDFDYVTFHDDVKDNSFSINLNRQKTQSNPYPDRVYLSFNSAAERQAAFETIREAMEQKAAPAKKRAPALKK